MAPFKNVKSQDSYEPKAPVDAGDDNVDGEEGQSAVY